MIALWPHWFRPWWLLLLPLLGWLLWQLWHRQKRAGRWQMILPPAFHAALLSGGSGRRQRRAVQRLGGAGLGGLLGHGFELVEGFLDLQQFVAVAGAEVAAAGGIGDGLEGRFVEVETRVYDAAGRPRR